MKNFYDLLTWSDTAQHGFAEGLLFDAGNEFFRDLKIDIGLEQCQSDVPQRIVDVRFADRAVTAQVLENVLEFIAELRKH